MMAADPAPARRGAPGPRLWAPALAVLAAAVVALTVIAITRDGGDAPVTVVCEPGTPGCELRQEVHWHADFALFIRGERYDFDDDRFYTNGEDGHSENVHLHRPYANVVHVHREGTTWREFLDSLGFTLEGECLTPPEGEPLCASETERLSYILNGVRVDSLAFQDITDIDRALISFGGESADELWRQYEQVTDEACILSLLCVERVPEGGIPDEGCGGGGTCS